MIFLWFIIFLLLLLLYPNSFFCLLWNFQYVLLFCLNFYRYFFINIKGRFHFCLWLRSLINLGIFNRGILFQSIASRLLFGLFLLITVNKSYIRFIQGITFGDIFIYKVQMCLNVWLKILFLSILNKIFRGLLCKINLTV